jgi:hypothetical protein
MHKGKATTPKDLIQFKNRNWEVLNVFSWYPPHEMQNI